MRRLCLPLSSALEGVTAVGKSMEEEETKASEVAKEVERQKDIAHYAASVEAWISTSLELDKSLLALSSGGIALIITFISTVGLKTVEMAVMSICAILSFLVCVVSVLYIFRKNKDHLKKSIQGVEVSDPSLAFADKIAAYSFGLAAILSAVIGVSAAINSLVNGRNSVSEEKKRPVELTVSMDSLNEIAVLKKSLNEINELKPQAPSQPSQSATQVTPPPPPKDKK
ncbi:Conserved hypothetical protein [gamma proteobacterium HdN1]|nr:Conserved hypothetical protein [gamma proteobacterium HdN1]